MREEMSSPTGGWRNRMDVYEGTKPWRGLGFDINLKVSLIESCPPQPHGRGQRSFFFFYLSNFALLCGEVARADDGCGERWLGSGCMMERP